MEKSGPEGTRGVLTFLHGQEMPLGKQEEFWRVSEKTRGCLRGLGGQRRAGGTSSVQKRGPECTRGVLSRLRCQELHLG